MMMLEVYHKYIHINYNSDVLTLEVTAPAGQ